MAKGNHIMGNRKGTSDAVGGLSDPSVFIGSTAEGGDSMPGYRDRKGGAVMSNARDTSNMVGGDDIIGAACGADPTVARRVAAAESIDAHIRGALQPIYCKTYDCAMSGSDMPLFESCSNALYRQMVSDEGVASLVKSVASVEKEFGGLGFFQRALARRLDERRKALAALSGM